MRSITNPNLKTLKASIAQFFDDIENSNVEKILSISVNWHSDKEIYVFDAQTIVKKKEKVLMIECFEEEK